MIFLHVCICYLRKSFVQKNDRVTGASNLILYLILLRHLMQFFLQPAGFKLKAIHDCYQTMPQCEIYMKLMGPFFSIEIERPCPALN
jgi:hypothetical protein